MHQLVLLVSLFCMVSSAFASPDPATSLASAMNQRIQVMKDVAGYKSTHHLPVEDLVREQKVLATAQAEAGEAGVDPQSVAPFIQAQMDAAKAIQYRYLADWLSRPEPDWKPANLEDVRARISQYDNVILKTISEQLKSGGFSDGERAQLLSLLNAPQLSGADKQHLVDSLALIKPKIPGQ